jgi:hypothetical protein
MSNLSPVSSFKTKQSVSGELIKYNELLLLATTADDTIKSLQPTEMLVDIEYLVLCLALAWLVFHCRMEDMAGEGLR